MSPRLASSAGFRVFSIVAGFLLLTSGVAIAANGSAPGDVLHGIDRAMDAVGILDGGPNEHVAEALSQVETNLSGALESAAEAAEEAGAPEASEALSDAAAGPMWRPTPSSPRERQRTSRTP